MRGTMFGGILGLFFVSTLAAYLIGTKHERDRQEAERMRGYVEERQELDGVLDDVRGGASDWLRSTFGTGTR